MDEAKRTEVRVSDTPETDSMFESYDYDWSDYATVREFCRRLERERNLALKIARKYYNGPELINFPNIKL